MAHQWLPLRVSKTTRSVLLATSAKFTNHHSAWGVHFAATAERHSPGKAMAAKSWAQSWNFTSALSTNRKRWCQPATLFSPSVSPGLTLRIHCRVSKASSMTAYFWAMARLRSCWRNKGFEIGFYLFRVDEKRKNRQVNCRSSPSCCC